VLAATFLVSPWPLGAAIFLEGHLPGCGALFYIAVAEAGLKRE